MNVISFSLYGGNPYTVGALKNVELARTLYPAWICRFYIGEDVASKFIFDLADRGAQLVNGQKWFPTIPPMLWRFLVADDPDVDVFLVRDTDSRIAAREVAAVNAWLASESLFHTMRDHPAHARPINGGMWGARRGFLPIHHSMFQLITDNLESVRGDQTHDLDQQFMSRIVWPLVRHHAMQHAAICRHEYPGAIPFPTTREGKRFVGEVFNEHDEPRPGDWQMVPETE